MSQERRIFEREKVNITFIYSFDSGSSLVDGEWHEAETLDIGPVLVGGLAFFSENEIPKGTPIRIALFVDLNLRESWIQENDDFPVIYHGNVCRAEKLGTGFKVAVHFKGFDKDPE